MTENESGGGPRHRAPGGGWRERFGWRRRPEGAETTGAGQPREFVAHWESPEAMRAAMQAYVDRPRFGQPELEVYKAVTIPTLTGPVGFTKEHGNWKTDRGTALYDVKLFGDEFRLTSHRDEVQPESIVRDPRSPLNGERDFAFRAGKTVVDLGSGEAVALAGYSLMYPDTTFIGVDAGYDKTDHPFIDQPGMQLVKDDWSTLQAIPDGSVDTVLSSQGLLKWGAESANPDALPKIIDTLNRITKSTGVVRYDWEPDVREQYLEIERQLMAHGWDVKTYDATKIATRIL